jgi:glycerol uptake facilitator-like aquaporin
VHHDLARRATAELVGTAILVAVVIGSGIAAQRLSPDALGLELLENSIATGAALVALSSRSDRCRARTSTRW